MIWGYILGGASIFALIAGLFLIYNGRATRKYIGQLIKEENERWGKLLEGHDKATREATEKMSEQHITMMEMLKR